MNRHLLPLLALAIAGLAPASAQSAYGRLTLSAPDPTHNRFTVTISGALNDSDTSDVSGTLGVALDANAGTGATSAFFIDGGNLAMQDMSFSGVGWSLNATNLAGTAVTDSPPGVVSPTAGGGTFSGALHRLIIHRGGIAGTVFTMPVSETFTRSSPLEGNGTGTGVLTVTPGSATSYHQLFNVVMTMPVDFTQEEVVSGQTIYIRVQGTMRATGTVAAPLYTPQEIAAWTFNTGATSAERRAASNVPQGAAVSTLNFNDSFTFAGVNATPSGDNDGFGFGGNSGDTVIFIDRANYNDSAAPVGGWTSWGPGSTAGTGSNLAANGNAPIAFTVTADPVSTVVIDSLILDWTGGQSFLTLQFQEAGATPGTPVFVPSGTLQDTWFIIPLAAPVVVSPGQSKTFTVNLDSNGLNSNHYVDGLALEGTVETQPLPPSIAEWTFNTGSTSAARRTAGNIAAGLSLSTLNFNQSFRDAGVEALPQAPHDSFGFGGDGGDTVIFLRRADYFDDSAVPSPRPSSEDYTSWGTGATAGTGAVLTANGNAPIAFTMTAGALSSILVDSVIVDLTNAYGSSAVFQFQEAGGSPGPGVTVSGAQDARFRIPLATPVTVNPGESKTFTINLDSPSLGSGLNLDGIALHGTVSAVEPPSIAEWTFNTGSTSAARRAASNVTPGATVSTLNFNASFTDFGPGVVPNGDDDGFGFGGNLTDPGVIFLARANYFDGSAPEGKWTSWGEGALAGTGSDLSANGNAPIAFTVTADALSSITLEGITVDHTSSGGIIFQFQEAGASPGMSVTIPVGTATDTRFFVPLAAPVVIGPDQTKTFTINLNSGAINSGHNIDGIALNGTVTPVPPPADILFIDTFSRADNTDLNASASGKSGTLGALNWVEVASAGDPFISNNTLRIGETSGGASGWSIAYPDHNFTDAVIASGGEFTVSVDLGAANSFGGTRFTGFSVGSSKAELDAWPSSNPANWTSDFFFGYDPTGTTEVKVFLGGSQNYQQTINLNSGATLSVRFSGISNFNAGSSVNYEAFINGNSVRTGSFTWSGTNENYIALYSNYTEHQGVLDNFEVRSASGTAADPFTTWAASGTLPGTVTFDGDLNGDGVQDGIAFLLGVANPDDDATGALPTASEDGSGGLVLTFDCLALADRGPAQLRVAHSNSLAGWTATTDVVPDADGTDAGGVVSYVVDTVSADPLHRVTATIDAAAASAGRLFGRIEGIEGTE